jgi:hypothetical protein
MQELVRIFGKFVCLCSIKVFDQGVLWKIPKGKEIRGKQRKLFNKEFHNFTPYKLNDVVINHNVNNSMKEVLEKLPVPHLDKKLATFRATCQCITGTCCELVEPSSHSYTISLKPILIFPFRLTGKIQM